MRSHQTEYNAIQFLNAWASTGSPKMLKAFLSSIFLTGRGKAPTKVLDVDSIKMNFSKQLHEEKNLLASHQEILARLILDLREIITPIVFPEDEENSRIQNYIKVQLLYQHTLDNDEVEINSFVQEATISAAMKIYEFAELLAEEMELDFEALKEKTEQEEQMEKILISDSPRFLSRSAHHNLDLEGVVADVLYEESRHYILYSLQHNKAHKHVPILLFLPSRMRGSSPLSSPRASPPPRLGEIQFIFPGEYSELKASGKVNQDLAWKVAEFFELAVMAVFFPFPCVLVRNFSLVEAIRNKSVSKKVLSPPSPVSELFKPGQQLPRPSDLCSSRGERTPSPSPN